MAFSPPFGKRSETSGEAHLSAEQAGPQTPSWLSGTHGHHGRPQGDRGTPRAWTQAPVGVSEREAHVNKPAASVVLPYRWGAQTLCRREEFVRCAKGLRRQCAAFSLQAVAPEAAVAPQPRVGFTVTKAVGTASERNRIKRRLRAATRRLQALKPLPPLDFVIVARRPCLDVPFEVLVDDLSRHAAALAKQVEARSKQRT